MYYAIIGDIVGSKEISVKKGINERTRIQKKLKEILIEINEEFSKDIAAKFIITLGDEFQGLLFSPLNILRIIDKIRIKLFPIQLRFGIGIGEIHTEINRHMAIGADGPGFHSARKMIDQIKSAEKRKMAGRTNIMIHESTNKYKLIMNLINSNLQLRSFIETKWTEKQRQIIEIVLLKNKNQVEAAKELKIAQSSVQRRLDAAGYYDYIFATESITNALMEVSEEKYEE